MRRVRRDDRGTVTAFVASLSLALLLSAGLVVDGGRIVDARLEASDAAASAARAGAQAVVGVRAGQRRLDPARAVSDAQAFLANTGHQGAVTVDGDRVVVRVSVTRRMVFIGLAGVGPRTVTAVRSARAVGD
jgi:Flp pilus assembly protein TadG